MNTKNGRINGQHKVGINLKIKLFAIIAFRQRRREFVHFVCRVHTYRYGIIPIHVAVANRQIDKEIFIKNGGFHAHRCYGRCGIWVLARYFYIDSIVDGFANIHRRKIYTKRINNRRQNGRREAYRIIAHDIVGGNKWIEANGGVAMKKQILIDNAVAQIVIAYGLLYNIANALTIHIGCEVFVEFAAIAVEVV